MSDEVEALIVTGKYISAHFKDSFSTKRKIISLLNSTISVDKGLSNQSICMNANQQLNSFN